MSIEDLLRERRIHRHETDMAAIGALVERARDDLASAESHSALTSEMSDTAWMQRRNGSATSSSGCLPRRSAD